ncbi:MAG: DUF4349 domain-containing protein [Chthoniobacterales bacterium]
MLTIHDRIEEFLAADFHDELSDSEREELHAHLAECAGCRALQREEAMIHKVLQTTLEHSRPAFGFEQRMLSAFRNRVPYRRRPVSGFFVNAIRSRMMQLAVVLAALLALFGLGQLLTGEMNSKTRLASSPTAPAPAPTVTSSFTAHAQVLPQNKNASPALARGSDSPAPLAGPRSSAGATEGTAAKSQDISPRTSGDVAPEASASSAAEDTAAQSVESGGNTEERKLIRNASVDLDVGNFDEALESITTFATDAGGYVATNSSQKQENGKLRGDILVKILPENLADFLARLRGIGDLKNQTLTTRDVGKQYLDINARLRNARLLEQRLVAMLDKNSGKVADLLEVEKELGRVREQIEQMEGQVKFMDEEVQFSTVTIHLAEKETEAPAAFLIKERVQLALFVPEVENVYANIRGLASAGAQITTAALDHDDTGRVSARVTMLVAPEESDDIIAKIKTMGRVANFQVQSERVARGNQGFSPDAKTEFDKVELNITIARDEDEPSQQQTTLSVRTEDVNTATKQLAQLAAQTNGRIRTSSFSRDPTGAEFANVLLRVPVKNYASLMQSLSVMGKLENISVHREDRTAELADPNAPADLAVTVYSRSNVTSPETGVAATMRRTAGQSAAALTWSLRMVGVALASIAPWVIVLGLAIGIVAGIRRSRRYR